jgi:transaldolase/glucose-6-phosphate isomerase
VLYVKELNGRDTVNTMPPATVSAFEDHGVVSSTVHKNVDAAGKVIRDLEELGIHMSTVTAELLDEGVKLFADAFATLMRALEAKKQALKAPAGV